jgi:hypothetical protein
VTDDLDLAVAIMREFPYGAPIEEADRARDAAVKLLWDKRAMPPENSEEIVMDVLAAAMPHFRFYPLGDNHHNASACPYCTRPQTTRRGVD